MLRRIALCLLLVLALPVAARDADLRIEGSNTLGERLVPALVEAWLAERGSAAIERRTLAFEEIELVAPGAAGPFVVRVNAHGSGTAVPALRAGTADLGMLSRPVSADEVASAQALGALDAHAQSLVVALDGLAVVVHPDSALRALSVAQVRAIFSGAIRDWSGVGRRAGPIRLHARDARSGTWDTFRSVVLQDASLHPSAQRYESTDALAAAVAQDPDAIGFVGLAGVGDARALAISDGGVAIAPERFQVAVEDYPLSRRLFLVRPDQASSATDAFVQFALSDAGQAVVERLGFVSQRLEAFAAPPRPDSPPAYAELVAGARRVSLNFRFGSGQGFLDTKGARDVSRLAAFLKQPAQQGQALMLLGFSDASEVAPIIAIGLSNDRVDGVARQLIAAGITPARVRGFGGAAPVSDNASAAGRARNRRVEVWLAPPSARAGGAASTPGGRAAR